MATKLHGALRWSAAEDAAVRIAVIRDTLHTANGSAADSHKQLRHGLHELDSIRAFLQEGINSCNQEFLDSGATDGVLHRALERGLSELEDVRRKVVTTLSDATVNGRTSAAAAAAAAATHSSSGAVGADGGTTSVPVRRQRPPSAPAARARRDMDGAPPAGASGPAAPANTPLGTMTGGRANSFTLNGIGGTRAPMAQRSAGVKARPQSATNRPTSATRRAVHGVVPPALADSGASAARPLPHGAWADPRTRGSEAPQHQPPPAQGTQAKPVMPARMRPASAPNRHRTTATTAGGSSAPTANAPTSLPVGRTPTDAPSGGSGSSGDASAWGKYQDWAQSVLSRVQSRRVQQHRQTLAKTRQGAAPLESTHTEPTASGPAPSGASSGAATNTAEAQAQSQPPPPTAPQRPASGKPPPLAQGPVLRRAQTASIARQAAAAALGATTSQNTSGSGHARPQSAGVRLGAQAQALREQGNIHFQQKKYRESADCYSRALAIEPDSETLHCNRAATYLMMNKFTDALHDALRVVEIDPTHVKAHWRAAKAYLYLGHPDEAKAMYSAAHKLAEGADRDSVAAELRAVDTIEKCRRCIRLREWQEALRCAEGILDVFPSTGPCAMPWMCLKAEALLHVNSSEANNLLAQMCADDAATSECWVLRAKALFYTGHDAVSTNSCLTYLQRARALEGGNVRVAPLETCITTFAKLRDEGNTAYAAGRWQEAHAAYTKCLSVDAYNSSLKAIILCNRAAVCIQCERWRDALDDINQSIGFNPHNAKAYTRRARIHQHNTNHDAAVKDLQLAVQMYPSAENQERLSQATELRNQALRHQQRQQQQQQQQQGQQQQGTFRYFNFASGQQHAGNQPGARPSTAGGARRPQSGGPQRPSAATSAAAAHQRQRTHYDLLGVVRNADERTIVRAYRDAALKWHPDKWAAASEDQRALAESTFKDVSIAYSVLKDATKRRQYDLTLAF